MENCGLNYFRPKDIWHVIGIDKGIRIKEIEMHVDGLEDCFLCCCTLVS
jgi:hypothetical protein